MLDRRTILNGSLAAAAGSAFASHGAAATLDADIFTAFAAWVALQREMEGVAKGMGDDFDALCTKADAAARHVLTFAPVTALGMAVQFHLVAHLAFGGAWADCTDVNFDASEDDLRIMVPMFKRASEMTASLRAGGEA